MTSLYCVRVDYGAFITTADFQKSAHDVAIETNFPRIGLVNGR